MTFIDDKTKLQHSRVFLNEDNFKILFDTHWKRLVAFCQHHVRDDEVAMDIVQEIFCSIWKRHHQLKLEVDMEYYLFRAARIKITDYYRERFKKEEQQICLSHSVSEAVNNTEDTIILDDLEQYIGQLVNKLPCRCRQVYTLSRNSGLSISEIATQLSLSEKTVEAHLTKALRTLKKSLRHHLTEK